MAAGHFGGGVGGEVGEDAYVGGGGVERDESWGAVEGGGIGGGGFVWQPGAEGEEGAFDVDFWFRRERILLVLIDHRKRSWVRIRGG